MKKQTLIFLLITPFVVGLLSFISIVVFNLSIASDIQGINWNYNDQGEGFKVREEGYELKAKPVIDDNLILAPGNELTWYIRNQENVSDIARIEEENGKYYLFALSEGNCEIVCSNVRGTKTRSMNATIYENGTIIINPLVAASDDKIDKTYYFGEYDLKHNSPVNKSTSYTKENAKLRLETKVLGEDVISQKVALVSHSENIKYDNDLKEITILGPNKNENNEDIDSFITLRSDDINTSFISSTFTFRVVDEGCNVYNYEDLMLCTNYNKNGEIVVLQNSLKSFKDVYEGQYVDIIASDEASKLGLIKYEPINIKKGQNLEHFGSYDFKNKTFNYDEEVYRFETTYNHEHIDNLNKKLSTKHSKEVLAAIRVQKDFYGNGHEININELAFPRNGTLDVGLKRLVPTEGRDLFLGPLGFVTISVNDSPNVESTIIKAYGQDNVGMYVDGDNITVNDIKLKNMDDNRNRANYAFSGTVMDINGDNVTIKNSILSNGKNIVRAFDTDNLTIDNSILKTSAEFNLMLGSNEYLKYDENQKIEIKTKNYSINNDFAAYFNGDSSNKNNLDYYMNKLIEGSYKQEEIPELYEILSKSQDYLNNTKTLVNSDGTINYASKIKVNDTLFGDSGIFSIAFETLFNGIYLYNGNPQYVKENLTQLLNSSAPSKIGGTSKPVHLEINGNTKFYDWKLIDNIDVNVLISERINSLISQISPDVSVSIDDFFPMKRALELKAKEQKLIYNGTSINTGDSGNWINTPFAWYGGGANLSTLDIVNEVKENTYSDFLNVDILEEILKNTIGGSQGAFDQIVKLLGKCVLFAAGSTPFKFITNGKLNGGIPELFDKSPQIEELMGGKQ